MKRIIFKALKSDLVRVNSINGLANFIQILISLVTSKITATYLGPAGVALLGQFANFFSGINTKAVRKLSRVSLMAFTSVFAVTFIQLQIRNFIITNISVEDAGYWQGITRISDLYLMFITSTLSIYYLPKLSELKTNSELKREIIKGYIFILPIEIICSLTIFLSRFFITEVFLAKTFLPMIQLFPFRLIGDILKIASWLLAYLVIAKAMTKLFIVTELVSGLSYYFLTRFFIMKSGIMGATYAYALNYFFYLVAVMIIFGKIFRKEKKYEKANNGISGYSDL